MRVLPLPTIEISNDLFSRLNFLHHRFLNYELSFSYVQTKTNNFEKNRILIWDYLLHHIRYRIHPDVRYIQHYHVHYIHHQHLEILKLFYFIFFSKKWIPVRASAFWNFGILHMLQVDRRAQLIFPQLHQKNIDGI